jgi:hypothetical protein
MAPQSRTMRRERRRYTVRSYLLVIVLILVMMGGYVAVLPLARWSDANTGLSGMPG